MLTHWSYCSLALSNQSITIPRFHNLVKPAAACVSHYGDVTWALRHLKSPATRLFVQYLAQSNSRENTKAPYCRDFAGNFEGTVMQIKFLCHGVTVSSDLFSVLPVTRFDCMPEESHWTYATILTAVKSNALLQIKNSHWGKQAAPIDIFLDINQFIKEK